MTAAVLMRDEPPVNRHEWEVLDRPADPSLMALVRCRRCGLIGYEPDAAALAQGLPFPTCPVSSGRHDG